MGLKKTVDCRTGDKSVRACYFERWAAGSKKNNFFHHWAVMYPLLHNNCVCLLRYSTQMRYFEMAVSNERKSMVRTFPRHVQEFFPQCQKHLTTVLLSLQTNKPKPYDTRLNRDNQVGLSAINSNCSGITKCPTTDVFFLPLINV